MIFRVIFYGGPTKSTACSFYFTSFDDTSCSKLQFVQEVSICFSAAIPDYSAVVEHWKYHRVIECAPFVSFTE